MKAILRWTIRLGFLFSISMALAKEGERPPREAYESDRKKCNISNEQGHHRPPPHHQNLTDEQIACLEGILGKPGESERPSREQVRAADAQCGIEVPDLPEPQE